MNVKNIALIWDLKKGILKKIYGLTSPFKDD